MDGPGTADANAAMRRAIEHFKIARAAGNTDLAGSFSPKRIATQNEKLAPLHTKRLDRKAKIDIEVVVNSRNGINGIHCARQRSRVPHEESVPGAWRI